jgi:hypothetical protein
VQDGCAFFAVKRGVHQLREFQGPASEDGALVMTMRIVQEDGGTA